MGGWDYETVFPELSAIAKDMNREDVLECYSEDCLRAFFSEQAESSSPSKMFTKLQASVDVRAEIHQLEREMDKEHFVELVTGGYFVAGGVDKLTKRPIFWTRSGLLNKNSWTYQYGSSRAKAFVRYALMVFSAFPCNVICQWPVVSETE